MTSKINLTIKKDYIYWFLKNFQLKKTDCTRLLQFIANNSYVLNKVNFTAHLQNHENALLISAKGADTYPFMCRINGVYYEDIDQIIHLLQYYPGISLYCRISVPATPACNFCHRSKRLAVKKVVAKAKKINKQPSRQQLLQAIDEALDTNNQEAFLQLTKELRKI